MNLEKVKMYLRIDDDSEDGLIELMMKAAEETITASVGKCDFTKSRVEMLFLAMCQNLYDNRTLLNADDRNEKMAYMFRSIITQLSVEEMMEEEA